MKHIVTALLLASFMASLSAVAGNQHTPDSLQLDCHNLQRPSQRSVSQTLEIHNFSAAYAARERVFHLARRACLRGADQVVIAHSPYAKRPMSVQQIGARQEALSQAR